MWIGLVCALAVWLLKNVKAARPSPRRPLASVK